MEKARDGIPPADDKLQAKVEGGYCLIPVRVLAALWFCLRQGQLRVLDVRVYLACHEVNARRCRLPKGKSPTFTLAEIRGLTGGTEKRLKASIERLEALGFLKFSESELRFAQGTAELRLDQAEFSTFLEQFPNHTRLLPVPRRILRLLCGGARTSLIATVLGHLIWGLYRPMSRGGKPGGFNATGRMKCSWVAETFGVDLRRVKQARKELIELGWLIPVESKQWELNRYGAKFQINLAWERSKQSRGSTSGRGPTPGRGAAFEKPAGTELPPPPAQISPGLPPPESDKNPPYGEHKNQKPASGPEAVGGTTGVKISESKESGAGESKPTLKHIVPEDLRETARLLELHAQAVGSGLLGSSENDRLHFFAAAEHARVIGTENPCGLFARLVRAKLWHYITQDDEDTASRRLKSFLHAVPTGLGGGLIAKPAPVKVPELSEDARLVRAVKAALLKAGYRGDPFPQFRREKPEWTRERWDQAVSEIEGQVSQRKSMTSVGELLDLEENL